MSNTFEFNLAPAVIESVSFAKAKPKSVNDDGAGVKKLKFLIDVTDEEMLEAVMPLFSGMIDDHTMQRVAKESGPGFEVRSKKKLGISVVKVHASSDNDTVKLLIETPNARVERPKLIIGEAAKQAWLELNVEMAIPKTSLGVIDDYFKADVFISVANAQMDLEDAVKLKTVTVTRGRKRGEVEATAPAAEA